MGWIVAIVILLAVIAVPVLMGNPGFWKAAEADPDLAYDWFVKEDCWVVKEPTGPEPTFLRPKEDYAGPFRLQVPKLGNQWVQVYGEADLIEESQERFLEQVGRA